MLSPRKPVFPEKFQKIFHFVFTKKSRNNLFRTKCIFFNANFEISFIWYNTPSILHVATRGVLYKFDNCVVELYTFFHLVFRVFFSLGVKRALAYTNTGVNLGKEKYNYITKIFYTQNKIHLLRLQKPYIFQLHVCLFLYFFRL